MRTYDVTITGTSPLLMHNDDIGWADQMDKWKQDNTKAGAKKEVSKAGDDRTPAHRWIGSLYKATFPDGKTDQKTLVVIPTDNIMRAIMEGAANVLIPGGKNGKTFKADSQSGIRPTSVGWPILIDGAELRYEPIWTLVGEKDFDRHCEQAKSMGFSLFIKRARVGQSKHVRVRPCFDVWSARGVLSVTSEMITDDALLSFLESAGANKGLGDWRPSSPKAPGPYGMFTATVKRLG